MAASTFGARGNGQTYGWNADNTGADPRSERGSVADQAYDTLTHLQKPANPNAVWEIAVPNGTYDVRIVSGDASVLRQRLPDRRRGSGRGQRHADERQRAGSRARRRSPSLTAG